MLPGEVTGCDGHPSAQRQRKMAKSLTGFLLQEIFQEDFAEDGMTESRREKAAEEGRSKQKKREQAEKVGESGKKRKQAEECRRSALSYREFLERINMTQEVTDKLVRMAGEPEEPLDLRANDPEHGLDELFQQTMAAYEARKKEPWNRISEEIYIETMKCFSRFVREHKVSYGVYGFDRGFWTPHQIEGKLFRIGELEYQIDDEEKVISIHIPSDADLSDDLVDASYAEQKQFFAENFPETAGWPGMCESWLLSPALKELLPSDSRILAFAARFEITQTNPDATDYLEWVYKLASGQQKSAELENLREDTSLQRRMKDFLRAGGKVGIAWGIWKES